jgi:hypothetical protein
MLLKMGREWTQAAATLRASNGSAAEERAPSKKMRPTTTPFSSTS